MLNFRGLNYLKHDDYVKKKPPCDYAHPVLMIGISPPLDFFFLVSRNRTSGTTFIIQSYGVQIS